MNYIRISQLPLYAECRYYLHMVEKFYSYHFVFSINAHKLAVGMRFINISSRSINSYVFAKMC